MNKPLLPKSKRLGGKITRTVTNCIGKICECLSDAIKELLNNQTNHRNGAKGLSQLVGEQTAANAAGPGAEAYVSMLRKFHGKRISLKGYIKEYDLQRYIFSE